MQLAARYVTFGIGAINSIIVAGIVYYILIKLFDKESAKGGTVNG